MVGHGVHQQRYAHVSGCYDYIPFTSSDSDSEEDEEDEEEESRSMLLQWNFLHQYSEYSTIVIQGEHFPV